MIAVTPLKCFWGHKPISTLRERLWCWKSYYSRLCFWLTDLYTLSWGCLIARCLHHGVSVRLPNLRKVQKNTFFLGLILNLKLKKLKQPFNPCFAHFVRFACSVFSHGPILLPNWKTPSRREMIEKWKSIWEELGSQFPDPLRLWRSRRLANPLSERLLLYHPPSTIDCFFIKFMQRRKTISIIII